MLDSTLTVLKFAGVLVSGVAGYIGTLSDQKVKGGKRPRWWRMFSKATAMRWAIAGLIVALLSQFAETLKASRDSKLADKITSANRLAQNTILSNLSLQSEFQSRSLSYIERLVAPLEPPRVGVEFEILLDKPGMSSLREHFSRVAPDLNKLPKAMREWGLKNSRRKTQAPPEVASAPIAPGNQGYQIEVRGIEATFVEGIAPIDEPIMMPVGMANRPFQPFQSCLATSLPNVQLELFSKLSQWMPPSQSQAGSFSRNPDLLAMAHPAQPWTMLRFDPLTRKATLMLHFSASTNWTVHPWVSAAPDLADADFCMTVTGFPNEEAACFRPLRVHLNFGCASILVTNLEPLIDTQGRSSFHAKLPPAERIQLLPTLLQEPRFRSMKP